MIHRKCKLHEADDIIAELYDEGTEIECYEIPYEEDMLIDTDGIRIVIPGLGLSLREGNVCVHDDEEDIWTADFSITLVYEKNEKDPSKYLYWEQDGPAVTLFNFLHEKGMSMDELENVDCEIEIELAAEGETWERK